MVLILPCSPTTGSAPSGGWGERRRRLCQESPQPLEISHHPSPRTLFKAPVLFLCTLRHRTGVANEAVWLTHCQGASSGTARTHTRVFLTPSPEPFPLAQKMQCPTFLPFFREPQVSTETQNVKELAVGSSVPHSLRTPPRAGFGHLILASVLGFVFIKHK